MASTSAAPAVHERSDSEETRSHAELERRPRPKLSRVLLLVALLCAAVLGVRYWIVQRGIEDTDDAQIDADVVAVPARIAGTVTKIHFVENQRVSEGELLAELDDAPAKARLAQAEANLSAAEADAEAAAADAEVIQTNAVGDRDIAAASLRVTSAGAQAARDQIREAEAEVSAAEATLRQSEIDRERAQSLVQSGAWTRAQLDQAETARELATTRLSAARSRLAAIQTSQSQAQGRVAEASAKLKQTSHVDVLARQALARLDAARAQVETAKAARDLAALELSYTKILAPHAGVVSKKSINEGQAVANGQAIVQLVPDERWVTANFKETQLSAMHVGQHARFTVDAYPGRSFEGIVQSFSGATGARFTLLPPDNATGNYTKIVQRVPVRIRIVHPPKDLELRPGMSVELEVDTREQG